MSDALTFKVRITSPGPEEAELLRAALTLAFGEALTLAKARKGSNPKYAHLAQVLAYGELELTRAELEAVAQGKPAKTARPPSPARRSSRPRKPAAAPVAYTQNTIALGAPQKRARARKVQP